MNARIASLMEPIGLHANHLHHLAAASHQLRQGLAVGVGERTCVRPDAFSEQGDDLGVERVGFGEPPSGTGEIPDLTGVDDGERQGRRPGRPLR